MTEDTKKEIVKFLLNDKFDYIEWWLYDSVKGERFVWDSSDNAIDLNKAEKLVEYILNL